MPPTTRYGPETITALLQRVARLRADHLRLADVTEQERERSRRLAEEVRTRRRQRWQGRYEQAFRHYERLLRGPELPGD